MTNSKKHPDELFTELVTENQARIYGYVYAIVHSSADTEALVQRTLLSLWQRFSDFEPGTDFCAWAISTARYEVLNFQKTRNRTSFLTEEMLSRLADRSIAIAHGLEELCEVPEKGAKKRGKRQKKRGQESQTELP